MPITKADAFEFALDEVSDLLRTAQDGTHDDLMNVFEAILEVIGILNMRLSKLEKE